MGILALGSLGEEAQAGLEHTTNVAPAIGGYDAEQVLASLLGEVGLLEDTLGGVNVWQVEGGARVTRIEDSRQAHAGLQRPHEDPVHLIVCYVADLTEVYGVYDLVVAIVLVAV